MRPGNFGISHPVSEWFKPKYSLSLNGSTGWVSTGFLFSQQYWTFSLWYKPNAIPASGYLHELISKRSYLATATNDFPLSLHLRSAGDVYLGIDGAGDWNMDYSITSHVVSAGAWHHIAATFDRVTLCLYVDGQRYSTPSTTAITVGSRSWAIGRASYEYSTGVGKTYCNGSLTDIRFYQYAKTRDQVMDIRIGKVDYQGLVNWFKCDDAGSVLTNSIWASDGTLNGGCTWVQDF